MKRFTYNVRFTYIKNFYFISDKFKYFKKPMETWKRGLTKQQEREFFSDRETKINSGTDNDCSKWLLADKLIQKSASESCQYEKRIRASKFLMKKTRHLIKVKQALIVIRALGT